MRMDAKHVVQKAHQEMSHLKRHFLVVVFAELAEPPAKDVRARPHAQHVPPPLQWTGANDSPFLSRLLTGGSGYFHGHHGQPSKLSWAVPDESLAIFDATPRPVRFPCPPSSREKRSPDLARALLAVRPITVP